MNRSTEAVEVPHGTRRHRIVVLGVLVGLIAYTGVLISHASYAVGGSDSSGYANLARSLLDRRVVLPVEELDLLDLPAANTSLFTPLGYTPGVLHGEPARFMTPYYPVGFPLHLAVAASILGWERGPFWISPLAAAACIFLMFAVGRRLGLTSGFAAAAALLLAVNPTFVFMALQPMSDVAAAAWALAMVWAGLRSREDDRWALAAGAAFGVAFLVRPTNILLLAPLVFCLRPRWKPTLYFVLGGVPAAAIFFGFNYAAYGHPLQTGYGTANLQDFIAIAGWNLRVEHYIRWISRTMSPLPLLLWLGVVAIRKIEWRDRALLVAWFGAFLAFYVCYGIYDEWWYTRFLLPGYPALILAATLSVSALVARFRAERPRPRLVACVALLLVPLGVSIAQDRKLRVLRIGKEQSIHAKACHLAEAQLPARSLVVAGEMSGAMKFYTRHSILRWEEVGPDSWRTVKARMLEKGYSLHALLMDQELEPAQSRVMGEWTELGRVRHVALWRVEPTAKPRPTARFVSGFSDVERDNAGASWRWMSDEGVIVLPNTGRPMSLRVEGIIPLESLTGPPTIRISFNGRVVAEATSKRRTFLKELLVTASDQGDAATSELRIATNRVFVPAEHDSRSGDRRRLGFSLTILTWQEVPDATR